MSAISKARQDDQPAGKSVEDNVHRLYLRRAARFMQHAVDSLPREVIEHALIAEDDAIAVFEIVNRPETIAKALSGDPLAEARARGRQKVERLLLMEGGCGTIKDAVIALGISKPAVEKRRRKGNLIAIDTGRKGILYPRWQFKKNKYGTLDGLEEVLRKLREQGCIGWSVLSFFLNPHIDLAGKSPLAAMRGEKLEDVLMAASNYGEMGR